MPAQQILQEARRLYKVSESLDMLAEQDVHLSGALAILSGSVRNSATLLEVLVTLRPEAESRLDLRSN
jgi:hypothetical protein